MHSPPIYRALTALAYGDGTVISLVQSAMNLIRPAETAVGKSIDVEGLVADARAAFDGGRLPEAESLYRQCLQHVPDFAPALAGLGLVAYKTGQWQSACRMFRRAEALAPSDPLYPYYRANAHFAGGAVADAADAYERALDIDSGFYPAWVNLGNTRLALGDMTGAIDASSRALALQPNSPEALSNLAQAEFRRGRLSEALDYQTRVTERRPGAAEAINNLGFLKQAQGDVEGAVADYQRALAIDPRCLLAERNLLTAILARPQASPNEYFRLHRQFAKRHEPGRVPAGLFAGRDLSPDKRLKIAWLGSDFHNHPVGRNILPAFEYRNSEENEIYVYAHEERRDDVSRRFRKLADHWVRINDLADPQVAARMRADEIDVLVCLAGRLNMNRPLVAAHRAAPVQISFHDGATSGLRRMDYWLTDPLLHPDDTVELFSEALFHLPVFYQFPAPEPPSRPDASRKRPLTFGCFNKPEKLSLPTIALWARILRALPAAGLMLKYRDYYCDPSVRTRINAGFAAHGVEPERIHYAEGDDDHASHLARHGSIDIALDPFPYNGATTTFDALSQGVPVVTLAGRYFIDRVGLSLLEHAGHWNLVADTEDEYVHIAVSLAVDPARRLHLRENLPKDLMASPLCDGSAYARSLDTAFREMWRRCVD